MSYCTNCQEADRYFYTCDLCGEQFCADCSTNDIEVYIAFKSNEKWSIKVTACVQCLTDGITWSKIECSIRR